MVSSRVLGVALQTLATDVNDPRRCGGSLLAEDIQDEDCIAVDAIDEPPGLLLILNAELMTSTCDGRHRSGVRQAEILPSLQLPQKETGLDPRGSGERRALDLTSEPNEGLVDFRHMA
jgi:hypothetical protein